MTAPFSYPPINGKLPDYVLEAKYRPARSEHFLPDGDWVVCGHGLLIAGHDRAEVYRVFDHQDALRKLGIGQ